QPPHPQRLDRTLTTRRHKQRFWVLARNLHALSVEFISNNQYPSRDRPDALPTLISISTA
ncbi:hypothetical protein, partial [Trueperella pyogenes]